MPPRKHCLVFSLALSLLLLPACATTITEAETPTTLPSTSVPATFEPAPTPAATQEPSPSPVSTEEASPEPFTAKPLDEFDAWWEDYKKAFLLDTSTYPGFWRGAYGSRLDELRYYLLHASTLRKAGVDSIMLGVDVVFDPASGEAKSLGDDVFIFYLQALKQEGFRIVLVPNPMHPNLDMGLGYEWEGPQPEAGYHRSYELIHRIDDVVVKWAKLAAAYGADVFVPTNEPYKLVRDYHDASRWLQEILPRIKEVYQGPVWAIDTMHDIGQGRSIPYPYDYSGYDGILCGPPAGRQDITDWEEVLKVFIQKGSEYVADFNLKGFGLYEVGAYTGGVWYEDGLEAFDQILSPEQAGLTAEAMVRQAEGTASACFPRVSVGWIDIDTPAFDVLANWYLSLGSNIAPREETAWVEDKLIEIEQKLAGDDYQHIFQILEITDTARQ